MFSGVAKIPQKRSRERGECYYAVIREGSEQGDPYDSMLVVTETRAWRFCSTDTETLKSQIPPSFHHLPSFKATH